MQRVLSGLSLFALVGVAHAQNAQQCGSTSLPTSLPVQPTLVAPLSPELSAPAHQLGAPTGVLAQTPDESLSVDNVLLRQRLQGCLTANAVPATAPALPSSSSPAAYKPQTKYDNSPWRFDMSQNGKRMTAEEFDAWMKARGVRVAKGAAGTTGAATVPAEPADPPEKKK
ncbi:MULTISPECIES: hypothetical protein [Lysobacteraceae]|uniref:Secreted protein n=1 Tax=Agrilutibacter niabensis TaxID=380628 RepID=A0ABU1VPZ2_9GAMM|nr:hypothetical protein [Lysobacter niabensis]MDR7099549.1 hypothetical protein [Lysobacter niabensis]